MSEETMTKEWRCDHASEDKIKLAKFTDDYTGQEHMQIEISEDEEVYQVLLKEKDKLMEIIDHLYEIHQAMED